MRHFSPHKTQCRADRRPSLMGYHFSSFNLAMKTLFLLFLAALGFTACTRRVVEHVEVHDTLRHSISDTLRELITLTDSVFIYDSTFIENGIPVRSQVIFHRKLIDRTSQHLHQSERDHARRQKTQHSAVRSVPFPFPGQAPGCGSYWGWVWVSASGKSHGRDRVFATFLHNFRVSPPFPPQNGRASAAVSALTRAIARFSTCIVLAKSLSLPQDCQ